MVGQDGSLLRAVGGRGEGPGEFGNVSSAIVARDGSYTVWGLAQIDLLESDGSFVRRIPTEAMIVSNMALPDGRLVATRFNPVADLFATGELPEEVGRPIYLIPLDGSEPEVHYTAWELPEDPAADDVDASPDPGTVRLSAGRAFEPGLYFNVLSDGRLALSDSIGYRIKLIGLDGRVTGVVERPIAPLPVSESIMEAERERYRQESAQLTSLRNMSFEIEREGAEALLFAEEVPVIGGVGVDWQDRIWVTRTGTDGDEEGPTDIVTPDGRYIGTLAAVAVRTPDAFGPDGLMAYIERNELDVPTVHVIRLVSLEPEG